ncbi:MAG: PEP-CTERM sorting domain-containing protein [Puniceicoccales bacterium]
MGSPLAGGYSPIPESSQAALMLGALAFAFLTCRRSR